MIPLWILQLPWKQILIVIALLGLMTGIYATGHHRGAQGVQERWDKQVAADTIAAQKAAIELQARSNNAETTAVEDQSKLKDRKSNVDAGVRKYYENSTDDCGFDAGRVLDIEAADRAISNPTS